MVPKTQNFSAGVNYGNQLITFDLIAKSCGESTELPEMISSAEDSGNFNGSLDNLIKVKALSTYTKEIKMKGGPNTGTDERVTIKSSQQKGPSTMTDGRLVKTRENKENADTIKFGVKRNNLMGERSQKSTASSSTRPFRKDRAGPNLLREGSVDEESTHLALLAAAKEQRSCSPVRNSSTHDDRMLLKKSGRFGSVDREENRAKARLMGTSPAKPVSKPGTSELKENTLKEGKPKKVPIPTGKPSSNLLVEKSPNGKPINGNTNSANTSGRTNHREPNPNNPWASYDPKTKLSSKLKCESPGKSSREHSAENRQIIGTSKGPKTQTVLNQQNDSKKPLTTPGKTKAQIEKMNKIVSNSEKKSSGKKYDGLLDENQLSRFTMLSRGTENKRLDGMDPDHDEIESIEENLEYEIMSNHSHQGNHNGIDKRSKTAQYQLGMEVQLKDSVQFHQTTDSRIVGGRENPKNQTAAKKNLNDINNLYEENKFHEGFKRREVEDNFDDSLEDIKVSERQREKQQIDKEINNLEDKMQNILNKVRPFSPPFMSGNTGLVSTDTKSATITKRNNETVVIGHEGHKKNSNNTILESRNEDDPDEAKMLEVVYDPVWNCYYDPKTNSYYEFKG